MRSLLVLAALATAFTLPWPGATATDTGSRDYLVSYGWLTDAYNYQNTGWIGTGTLDCGNTEAIFWTQLGEDRGCIGGTRVYTSEAWALYRPGVSLATLMDSGVKLYLVHRLTVTDQVTGSNVMIAVCNSNTERNHNPSLGRCDSGEQDGAPDAYEYGCGLTLTADATGIHDGNFWTSAVVFTIGAEVTTSNVCLGTSGTTSVIYSDA